MAIQCSMLGLAMCWFNIVIGYVKSRCVHNMAYIKDPTACWYGNPFDSSFPFVFLCNFTLGSNGTPMGLQSSIENTSIFPWGIWFGWCVPIVHHDSFIGNNLKTSKKWKIQGSWNGTIILTNKQEDYKGCMLQMLQSQNYGFQQLTKVEGSMCTQKPWKERMKGNSKPFHYILSFNPKVAAT
jgi:hypothetical protein